ncbi:MAG: hypothetical protein QOH58_57 [Thermoleophilaceae bacterium]|nr:hypothetical protein [Thermoleophilaceae bacterium]
MRRAPLLLAALLALGCLGALPSAAGAAKTVWLCKPGKKDNPCEVGLRTTRFSPSLERLGVDAVKRTRKPKFDCFYVYPTVSDQDTPNANFDIDPELRSIALYQAARYSSECRIYAPVYRQITLAALFGGGAPNAGQLAYGDVRDAWRRYLKKFNRGRGVVVIGHSQGTFMLRELLTKEIDPKPRLRRRVISALLLGGNVTVKQGRDTGGDFKHIPACRSRTQVGCVVAFSIFNAPVPAEARFGRTAEPGLEVLCTNPAALGGGSGKITPVYPSEPFAAGTTIGATTLAVGFPVPEVSTPWLTAPDSYRARCSSAGGADVLHVSSLRGAPVLNSVPDAGWGLHLTDANLALGDLVSLVRTQAAAWLRAQRG